MANSKIALISKPTLPSYKEATHKDSSLIHRSTSTSSSSSSVTSFSSTLNITDEKLALDNPTTTEDQILSLSLAFIPPTTTTLQTYPRLSRPIAIPQTRTGDNTSSYLRAYSPLLTTHGIPASSFLQFLDTLSILTSGNLPLQAAQLAGFAMSCVPFHYVMIAGIGLQITAKVGETALGKIRIARFLKKVNEEFFNPRGLKVSVLKGEKLRTALNMPTTAPLIAPFYATAPNGAAALPQKNLQRRLAAVASYSAPLETSNIPAPAKSTNPLARLAEKKKTWTDGRMEKKSEKQFAKAVRAAEQAKTVKGKGSKKEGRKAEKDSWVVIENL